MWAPASIRRGKDGRRCGRFSALDVVSTGSVSLARFRRVARWKTIAPALVARLSRRFHETRRRSLRLHRRLREALARRASPPGRRGVRLARRSGKRTRRSEAGRMRREFVPFWRSSWRPWCEGAAAIPPRRSARLRSARLRVLFPPDTTQQGVYRKAGRRIKGIGGQGSGIGDQGPGIRGQGSGVRGQGSGIRDQGPGVRGQGSGIRGQGSGIRGQGSGVRDQGSGIRDQGSGIREREGRMQNSQGTLGDD